jgi:lantibiotic modifying enzyme
LSALGADPAPQSGLRVSGWRHINTDQMMLEKNAPAELHQHRARLNGIVVSPADYLENIRFGFRVAYEKLLEHRKDLLSGRLTKAFDGLELRILVRDSATYGQVHVHLLHPEFLKDGVDRSIELEWLARPLCARRKSPASRFRIYRHEVNAMEQLDIPRFGTAAWRDMRHAPTSYEALVFGGARDSSVLRRRLSKMSARACFRQMAVITRSLRVVLQLP